MKSLINKKVKYLMANSITVFEKKKSPKNKKIKKTAQREREREKARERERV